MKSSSNAMIDLRPDHLETVTRILAERAPDCEVRAFGSRADWTAKDHSDLDLALVSSGKLNWQRLARVREAFEESDLPFRVDVLDWHGISDEFRQVIAKQYEVIQKSGQETQGMAGSALSDYAEIVMGQSPPGETCNTTGEGLPLLNGPTEYGSHHPAPVQFTTDARKRAKPGDVLFCVRGSTTGRMNWADREYAIGRGVAAIRHKGCDDLQPFVRAVIEYGLPGLLLQATGSTFPNVSADQLAGIWWPPLDVDEQRAIAHILGTLDDKIELNRRMSETLEAMARALFKSWFIDFEPVRAKAQGRDPGLPKALADLFPDRLVDSELGEIPEGWEVATLGEYMLNFDSKRVPVSGSERANRKGPFPYHGAAGVMDYVDDYLFDGIYLLVGEDGSVVDDSGLGVTQYVWGKLWVNNHAHVLQGKGAVSTEQLFLYFHFEPVAPYVTGAVQPKLSQGRMNMMPFVFAGEDVCRSFRELSDPWFAKLRSCAEKSRTLAALRDTLLPKLISGELRVMDAEKFIGRVG